MMRSVRSATLALAAASIVALAQSSQAQTSSNLFPLTFRAVCTSTNTAGGIFQEQVLNANLISDCAADHNITNLNTLRLVYNRTNNSIQVVNTNGVAVCTNFAFTGGVAFTNTNNTMVVFQRNVVVGTNSTASGVIFGAATYNVTNLANSYGLRAELTYIEPAVGTNPPSLCRAALRVGSALGGDDEDDNDDDDQGPPGQGNKGGNGNHYGWQNPHNPHSHR